MRIVSYLVLALSSLAMVLGLFFFLLGTWGTFSSTGSVVLAMEPGWQSMDYVMWGFILTIVGYLGILRARDEAGEGRTNG